MIICLIFIGFIVVGGLGLLLTKLIDEFSQRWVDDVWYCIFGMMLAIGLIFTLVCGGVALSVQVNEQIDYEATVGEREILVYRIEHRDESTPIELSGGLYTDIINFNNSIRKTKARGNNPWVSWFYNQKIANNVDFITLDTLNE